LHAAYARTFTLSNDIPARELRAACFTQIFRAFADTAVLTI